jgi:hypothetical protein
MVLGTTREFLELFGLNSLSGLPPLKDFVEPPSSEGIDEEPPLPFSTGDAGEGGGSMDDTAAAVAALIEQETEHGQEPETDDGEPDAPEARDDGGDPAADTSETG